MTLPPPAPEDQVRLVAIPNHPFPAMTCPTPAWYDGRLLPRPMLADLLLLGSALTTDVAAMSYADAPIPPEPVRLALVQLTHELMSVMRNHGREARDGNHWSRRHTVTELVQRLRTLGSHGEHLPPMVRAWMPAGLARLQRAGWPVPVLSADTEPPCHTDTPPAVLGEPLDHLETWAPAPTDHAEAPHTAARMAVHYDGAALPRRLLASLGCAQMGLAYDLLYGPLWDTAPAIRESRDVLARRRLTALTAQVARFHASHRLTAAERREATPTRQRLLTRYVQHLNAYDSPYPFAEQARVMFGVIEARYALANAWWPVVRRVTHRPAEDVARRTAAA